MRSTKAPQPAVETKMRPASTLMVVLVLGWLCATRAGAGDGRSVDERLASLERRMVAVEALLGQKLAEIPAFADVDSRTTQPPKGASDAAKVLFAEWADAAASALLEKSRVDDLGAELAKMPQGSVARAAIEPEYEKALAAYRRAWDAAKEAKSAYEVAIKK